MIVVYRNRFTRTRLDANLSVALRSLVAQMMRMTILRGNLAVTRGHWIVPRRGWHLKINNRQFLLVEWNWWIRNWQ